MSCLPTISKMSHAHFFPASENDLDTVGTQSRRKEPLGNIYAEAMHGSFSHSFYQMVYYFKIATFGDFYFEILWYLTRKNGTE